MKLPLTTYHLHTYYLLLTTQYRTTHNLPLTLTTCYSPLTSNYGMARLSVAHLELGRNCLLLTTYLSPLATYCSLLTMARLSVAHLELCRVLGRLHEAAAHLLELALQGARTQFMLLLLVLELGALDLRLHQQQL